MATSISALRTSTITAQGFTDVLGNPLDYSDLSPEQQIQVTNLMNAYVAANPSEFDASTAQFASSNVAKGGISDVTNYGVTDAVSDFADEVGNQVVSLNSNLNPFSEKNRGAVFVVAVIGIFIYLVGPKLIESFLAGKKGASKPSIPKP